jgi:hypothetical protein
MLKSAAAAVIAALVVALAPLAASDASTTAPGTAAPPNPCTTFTFAAARTVLGVGKNTRLTEKLHSYNVGYKLRACTIKYHSHLLAVETQRHKVTFENVNCYRHRTLGSYGRVCQSDVPNFPDTYAAFRKNHVYYIATINKQLPSRGAKIYTFALAMYKKV